LQIGNKPKGKKNKYHRDCGYTFKEDLVACEELLNDK